MATKRKIPFGLRDGRLFQPDEVARGLACNCNCPGCGARLVAHHGEKKVKHFVHYSAACVNGFESAIHKAAKQILLESKRILVPAIHASEFLFDRGTNVDVREVQSIAERFVPIDDVEVEKDLGSVVPDLVVSSLGRKLFIEIAYTHFVDEVKMQKLKKYGVATLEVDLSDLSEVPNMSELARLVVEESSNRFWVYNPKQDELTNKVEIAAKQKLSLAIEREQSRREKHKQWTERYRNMSGEEKLSVELNKLGITRAELPAYLGVFVKGGNSFSSHSRVWQTAIYANFIFRKEHNSFEMEDVCNWSYQFFKVKRAFPNSEKVAIWYFLKHLASLGLIWHVGRQCFYVNSDKPTTKAVNGSEIQTGNISSVTDMPF